MVEGNRRCGWMPSSVSLFRSKSFTFIVVLQLNLYLKKTVLWSSNHEAEHFGTRLTLVKMEVNWIYVHPNRVRIRWALRKSEGINAINSLSNLSEIVDFVLSKLVMGGILACDLIRTTWLRLRVLCSTPRSNLRPWKKTQQIVLINTTCPFFFFCAA